MICTNNSRANVEQVMRWIESADKLSTSFISDGTKKLLKDALKPIAPLSTMWASIDDELVEVAIEINDKTGSYGYTDTKSGEFIPVSQSELEQCQVDVQNFIKNLQVSVGLTAGPIELVADHFWFLGSVLLNDNRVAPLFLARALDNDVISFDIINSLTKGDFDEGVIISTAPRINGGYSLAGQQLARLNNVSKITKMGISLDMKKLGDLFMCHSNAMNNLNSGDFVGLPTSH
ncbi:MAG: hypothetical protein HOM11_11045 [Methylococcales bacterium]|jgi:hypothetical protein|nr:hypothetical protein [Methylococcales bacterium]MBT7444778.1 hypothetical protein [Methylococcales bacterium]